MNFAIVIVLPVAAFIAALLIRRWWALLLPVLAWPAVFLSLYVEGIAGDFWQVAMLVQMVIGLAAGGAGLMVSRLLRTR